MKFIFDHDSFKRLKVFGSSLPPVGALAMLVWQLYVRNFKAFMRISLLQLILFPLWLPVLLTAGQPLSLGMNLALNAFATAGSVFVYAIMRPALIATIYVRLIGHEVKPRQAIGRSFSIFWRYLLVMAVLSAGVALGFSLWFIPGVILAIYFMFAEQVIVLEEEPWHRCFRRSYGLVRGRFWAVLWRVVVVAGLIGLTSAAASALLIQLPQTALTPALHTQNARNLSDALFVFLGFLLSTFTTPLFLALQVTLFAELRKLKPMPAP